MVIFKKQSIANIGCGIPAPDAVWRLVALHATTDGVRLVFYAWANKEAHDNGEQPLPNAVKEYSLPAGTISAYPDLETGINMAAWAVAAQTQDVVDEAATQAARATVAEAAEVKRSFFADATDVK